MADDKDKIIVIEEEQKPQEEIEKQEELQETPKLAKPGKKNKKKLFLGIGFAFFVLIIILVLAFVFFSKNYPPKKVPQPVSKKITKTKENLDLHFIEGLNLENKGNLKDAIEEFKKSNNYLFLAYLNIAKIYQMQNDGQMAYEYIKKANDYLNSTLSNPSEYIDSYMYLFSYYLQNNHFNEARNLLHVLQSAHLKNHEVQIMDIYYNFITQKTNKNVLNQINQMLKEGYRDKILYEIAGYVYASQKNYPKAIEYFSKVDNLSSEAERNIAFLEFARNNLISASNYAIDSLNKKQDPQLAYFAYLLALKNNQIQIAYSLVSNLNSDKPINKFSIVPTINKQELLKQTNFKDHNISLALQSLLIMQLIKPLHYNINPSSNVEFGNIYLSFGLLNQAKESYLNAIGASASLNFANQAYAYFKENNLPLALTFYQKASENNPSNPILYYNLALLYEKNHAFNKAKQMFSILISRYPNFPLPYFNMALINFTEGSSQQAQVYLKQFLLKYSELRNKSKSILIYNAYADSLLGKLKSPQNISVQNFVLLKAISNNDFDYLKLEKNYLNDKLRIDMGDYNMLNVMSALSNFNPELNRVVANLYLLEGKPDQAIKIFANLNNYNAQDYYKMALCYLLLGYKNQADNYLTKSILLSKNSKDNYTNPLFAKLVIQIMNKNLSGMQELTKKINSNGGLLSFDIEVKK
ncbi:TPR repeat [Desulfurella amilsii]|uniref:TPR repeat n=1 Tax=Desulfurella amilsii TaxID=1562698 RepID=A0A1X4XYI8_9BACT|nr:tetratricopeptide repeat protein [Desulfurella amilsii]OSS42598.1 TPR repeat [Desulfurella amilsii]